MRTDGPPRPDASTVPAARSYRLRPQRLGTRSGFDFDKALRLASELEDAETMRKLRRDSDFYC